MNEQCTPQPKMVGRRGIFMSSHVIIVEKPGDLSLSIVFQHQNNKRPFEYLWGQILTFEIRDNVKKNWRNFVRESRIKCEMEPKNVEFGNFNVKNAWDSSQVCVTSASLWHKICAVSSEIYLQESAWFLLPYQNGTMSTTQFTSVSGCWSRTSVRLCQTI